MPYTRCRQGLMQTGPEKQQMVPGGRQHCTGILAVEFWVWKNRPWQDRIVRNQIQERRGIWVDKEYCKWALNLFVSCSPLKSSRSQYFCTCECAYLLTFICQPKSILLMLSWSFTDMYKRVKKFDLLMRKFPPKAKQGDIQSFRFSFPTINTCLYF